MTRKAWTTDPQKEWLEARLADFRDAQHQKALSRTFFHDTFKAWKEKWPISPPTEEEIAEAGSVEKAKANKVKNMEARLQSWFHNHTRSTTSGSGSRGLLKVNVAPKMLQGWQAYNKYRTKNDSDWKDAVDKAWKEYRSNWDAENPGVKPPKRRFVIANDFIKEKYAEETPEMLEKVEEFRKRLKDDKSETLDEENMKYQASIDKLPRTLTAIGDSLVKQTGWNVTILMGGPTPLEGGKIKTYITHFGNTNKGLDFENFLTEDEYEDHIIAPFDDFLHASFSSEMREKRAQGMPGSKSSSPVDEETDEEDERVKEKEFTDKVSHAPTAAEKPRETTTESGVTSGGSPSSGIAGGDTEPNEPPTENRDEITGGNTKADELNRDGQINSGPCDDMAIDDEKLKDIEEQMDVESAQKSVETTKEVDTVIDTKARNSEKSAEIEQRVVEEVEDAAAVNNSKADNNEKPVDVEQEREPTIVPDETNTTKMPLWLSKTLPYLEGISNEKDWQDLVVAFIEFEKSNPQSGKLPTLHRPAEVAKWLKLHANKKNNVIKVKSKGFGASYMKWWTVLQPVWRRVPEDGTLAKEMPQGQDWNGLAKGGTAGIYIVVMALSWWVKAQSTKGDAKAWTAVQDLIWVLTEMKATVATSGGSKGAKRGCDESQVGKRTKRQRLN